MFSAWMAGQWRREPSVACSASRLAHWHSVSGGCRSFPRRRVVDRRVPRKRRLSGLCAVELDVGVWQPSTDTLLSLAARCLQGCLRSHWAGVDPARSPDYAFVEPCHVEWQQVVAVRSHGHLLADEFGDGLFLLLGCGSHGSGSPGCRSHRSHLPAPPWSPGSLPRRGGVREQSSASNRRDGTPGVERGRNSYHGRMNRGPGAALWALAPPLRPGEPRRTGPWGQLWNTTLAGNS
jgi:hypothetical protein